MDIQEMSTEFDVLYNNITSNQAPGINEYEKSVLLTKAQDQLVNEYFNGRVDGVGGGFDGSQRRQYDFSSLIRINSLINVNGYKKDRVDDTEKLDRRSLVYLFPADYFLSVNEILSDSKWQYSVIPVSYSEYQRLMLKPYNFPVKRAAWRLITDKRFCNTYKEIIEDNLGYEFTTSWANKGRKLKVNIYHTQGSVNPTRPENAEEIPTITYSNGSHPKVLGPDNRNFTFWSLYNGVYAWRSLGCQAQWDDVDTDTYYVKVTLTAPDNDCDDEDVVNILKLGFSLLKEELNIHDSWKEDDSLDVVKVAAHTDGFQYMTAPSRYNQFDNVDGSNLGKTFTTSVSEVPMIELIGKFADEPTYQLRYIQTLSPIILDDLSNYGTDLTIRGESEPMPCKLPEEAHQEVLERAVTLAKIAWQGGTMTQAAAQSRDRRRDD